jgi:tetratricopeptide (TPR) repeat protein
MRRDSHLLIGFAAVLVFAWCCYQPAISGAFQLDDYVNLAGLSAVEDTASAVNYISSGIAGPTGRPLALASFAVQADQWKEGPAALIQVNILIHLVNALLLAVCVYQLSLQRAIARYEAALVATVAASLWVLMPLLASTSLYIVQRMTTLSAMFMLLGLSGYLFARARLHDKPTWALAGMSASLVVGSGLAALCKEIGFLLPVFVLVLEATVLERPGGVNNRHWRIWHSVFLVAPLVLLLVYLATWLDYSDSLVNSRGFTAWERATTEARVLWIYLSKAVLGVPSQLGIYQYQPTISRSLFEPATFLACIAWLALLATSIAWRRRYPLFAVAVLWYLAGHLVESTVVSLELYFEHRNYMPIVGPLFGLSSFLVLRAGRHRKIGAVLVTVLALVNAWFLYSFSSLSGQPSIAARYWAATYPDSKRAVSRMAMYQLEEEGLLTGLETIEKFVRRKPEFAYMRLQQLGLLCRYAPEEDHRWIIEKLGHELPVVDYVSTVAWMFFELLNTTSNKTCNGVDPGTVVSLATMLHNNPRYTNEPQYNRNYHMLLADVASQRGQYEKAVEHVRQAISYWPTMDLNKMMVRALIGAGDLAGALDFIDDAEARAPVNPLKAMTWRRDLESLREQIRNLEQENEERPEGPLLGGTGLP